MRTATAFAPPNIALVKYWGKAEGHGNRPAADSLSMTLSGIGATTKVRFDPKLSADSLLLNDQQDTAALTRVSACLDHLRARAGLNCKAHVVSRNNFPTGAGLASSAAGFAALVVAANAALEIGLGHTELSRIARQASGSAARSLFGGYVVLPAEEPDPAAEPLFDAEHFPLKVVIAIVSHGAKAIGSTTGMLHTSATSDYYAAWLAHQSRDVVQAKAALAARDFVALAAVAEASCLKMHGAMLAARPGLMYWMPATLACLHKIRALSAAGVPVFFTIDAGPQVKAFCLPDVAARVAEELASLPGVLSMIHAGVGAGARVIE